MEIEIVGYTLNFNSKTATFYTIAILSNRMNGEWIINTLQFENKMYLNNRLQQKNESVFVEKQ